MAISAREHQRAFSIRPPTRAFLLEFYEMFAKLLRFFSLSLLSHFNAKLTVARFKQLHRFCVSHFNTQTLNSATKSGLASSQNMCSHDLLLIEYIEFDIFYFVF